MELRIAIAAAALAVAGLVLLGLSAAALGTAKAAAKWPVAGRPKVGAKIARVGVALGIVLSSAAAGLAASMAPLDNQWLWYAAIAGAAIIALALTSWVAVMLASKIELSALINSPSPIAGDSQPATPSSASQLSVPGGSPQAAEIAYGQPYPGVVAQNTGHDTTPPEGVYLPSAYPVSPPPVPPEVVAGQAPDGLIDGVHTTTPHRGDPATRSATSAAAEANSSHVQPTDTSVPAEALAGWVYTDEAENWYLVVAVGGGFRLMRLADFTIAPVGTATGQLQLAGSIEMTVWPTDSDGDPETETE